jgi:hypothetical protein
MNTTLSGCLIIAVITGLILAAGCVTVNINSPLVGTAVAPAPPANVTPVPTVQMSSVSDFSSLPGPGGRDVMPAETRRASNLSSYATVKMTLDPTSKSDINKRFQEVVFGNEAQYLNQWENRYIKLGIAGDYTKEDLTTPNTFVLRFNNESDTTKLTLPYESETQEFTIRLVPASYFLTIDENKVDKLIRNTETGEILFVDQTHKYSWVETDVIYINSRFTGDERKYILLRGLLYDLGFEGYTNDRDSIFCYEATTTNLSEMDWAVVDLLYSKKFSYGESLSSVKSKLN